MGGRYDSTNIVPKPIATGITALGIDHVSVLGKTLKDIAWQKSGIYKVQSRKVFSFTVFDFIEGGRTCTNGKSA